MRSARESASAAPTASAAPPSLRVIDGGTTTVTHSDTILAGRGLGKSYGGVVALEGIDIEISRGEFVGLVGPNGAGKSTLFKLICSFVTPTSGRVKFNGQTITGLPPHEVARLGVVRTFQETTIFKEMTALQNVIVAHQLRSRATSLGIYFASAAAQSLIK